MKIWKVLLILLLVAPVVNAQIHTLALDTLLTAESGNYLSRVHYAWKAGERLSGYGNVSRGENDGRLWFSANFVDIALTDWLYVGPEMGVIGPEIPGKAYEIHFWAQIGIGVRAEKIPALGKAFVFLKPTYYWGVKGPAGVNQLKIAWLTKKLELGRFNFWSQGFYRFRESAPDVGQPQFLASHDRWPWLAAGFEPDIFDGRANLRAGVKFIKKL